MTAPSLIERLEGAAAGSRELDAAIWAALLHPEVKVISSHEAYHERGLTQVMFTLPPKRKQQATQARGPYKHAEAYSVSLDAALALAERVLPGWICGIDTDGNAEVWDGKYVLSTRSAFVMRQPALALCIAILRARKDTL